MKRTRAVLGIAIVGLARALGAQNGPPPTGVQAVATGPSTVTVSWPAAEGVRGYAVGRNCAATPPTSCQANSMRLSAFTTRWDDDGLTPGTRYSYKVAVQYTTGQIGVAEVFVTTPVPPPAPIVRETRPGGGRAGVTVVTPPPLPPPAQPPPPPPAPPAPPVQACPITFANKMAAPSNQGPGQAPGQVTASSGCYRVLITGFAVALETVDDRLDLDGKKDEVYAAAAAITWDRNLHQVLTREFAQTREYGDVGNGSQYGYRFRAGSVQPSGGFSAGNGTDWAPQQYHPALGAIAPPALDGFSLLVWEGKLTAGVEGLLIVPSLWESDRVPLPFEKYRTKWQTAPVMTVLNSTAVQQQFGVAHLTSAVAPQTPEMVLQTVLTSVILGAFGVPPGLLFNNDRPIGLTPFATTSSYQDRYVLITQEKLASLGVGNSITMLVPFAEPKNDVLNGLYTLYLRVERTR